MQTTKSPVPCHMLLLYQCQLYPCPGQRALQKEMILPLEVMIGN